VTSPVLERRTPRLLLRGFVDDDRSAFAAINADPVVMEHYPAPLTRNQSDAFVDRVLATWAEHGYGLWAVERRDTATLIGYAGLWPLPADLPVRTRRDPCAEVGWRLAAAHWGKGFATEAAAQALHLARVRGLAEVVSFTAATNVRSQAVMRRLGMTCDPRDDFDHPAIPPGHVLRRHVLYRWMRPSGSGAATALAPRTPAPPA
jgi:ribosomal-protein-alanine N-acetyltransferase